MQSATLGIRSVSSLIVEQWIASLLSQGGVMRVFMYLVNIDRWSNCVEIWLLFETSPRPLTTIP